MIITKISDGFGNQLFMYACGYAVSRQLNTKLWLDATMLSTNEERNLELTKLNIKYDKLFTVEDRKSSLLKKIERYWKQKKMFFKCKIYNENLPYIFDEKIFNVSGNTYISGYWQSEKYFKKYSRELKQMFTPKYQMSFACKEYIRQASNCNSVAVHVRRGDYNKIGICIKEEYYHEAIMEIMNRVDNPIFFVFSDDIAAAQKILNIKNANFIYVKYESLNLTLDVFFILKSCKHQIIANSTFSWWAAWLNDNDNKYVICPEYKYWKGDYYPKEWIKIKCE